MIASPDVKQQLRATVRAALILRVIVAVVIELALPLGALAPDEQTYDLWSLWVMQYWSGDSLLFPGRVGTSDPAGFFYIVAALYYLFGQLPIVGKLLNAVVGALCVSLTYDVAFLITRNEQASLRSARYVAYFPSLVLWSTLLIRDVWVVLLILLITRLALSVQERPTSGGLLALAGSVAMLTQFRAYLLFAIGLPMLVSMLVRQRGHLARNVVLGMLFSSVVIYLDAAAGTNRRMRTVDLEDLQRLRQWSSTAASSGFAQDANVSTVAGAVAFLPIGLTYFMFAPFPWTVLSSRQIFTAPEMLFFYSLVPAMIRGVVWLLRYRLGDSLMAVLLTSGLTLGYAVGQGNVGTIYRHRAQVLPFFLIFAAAGVERKLQGAAPAQPAPLSRAPGPMRLAS